MREILKIDGVTSETKEALKQIAVTRFGKASASLLVRKLIEDELSAENLAKEKPEMDLSGKMVRVEIRLPKSCVEAIDRLADARFSSRNYYIAGLVYGHLGVGQLQGDEIEVLRKSNYEMSKIGTNLNQIAKGFNTLFVTGSGSEKAQEIGKLIATLKKEVKTHTAKVLRVLNEKTVIWETKGKGSNSPSQKKSPAYD